MWKLNNNSHFSYESLLFIDFYTIPEAIFPGANQSKERHKELVNI